MLLRGPAPATSEVKVQEPQGRRTSRSGGGSAEHAARWAGAGARARVNRGGLAREPRLSGRVAVAGCIPAQLHSTPSSAMLAFAPRAAHFDTGKGDKVCFLPHFLAAVARLGRYSLFKPDSLFIRCNTGISAHACGRIFPS